MNTIEEMRFERDSYERRHNYRVEVFYCEHCKNYVDEFGNVQTSFEGDPEGIELCAKCLQGSDTVIEYLLNIIANHRDHIPISETETKIREMYG